MKLHNLAFAIGMVVVATGANAAGPLYTTDGTNPQPIKWDTSKGPIPVYTDGGEAFTFDYDGETPFLTIERANEITAHAFKNWSDVPSSTFSAEIAGTIEQMTGIADVTGANAADIYGKENGYGFWVLYDTDGSILEDFFGVPKSAVLGIAFPEWTDSNGNIIEATAVMNGWNVWDTDTEGNNVAGVFTHEFGHAINLSHSQTNGQLAYMSYYGMPKYPGVPGCGVEPVYNYFYPADWGLNSADPAIIETMFPFIDHSGQAAAEQSTIEHPDDVAAISNIYPTPDYASSTGSISGVLRLKDGKTEFSGINVIARNVNNPLFDAVSDMTGSSTQGKVGPDGRFTIRNLTPGEEYVLYIEEISAGGYPTMPQRLLSQQEYWNVAEGSDPQADDVCEATPIVAEAGITKQADFYFNGYKKGIQVTPLVTAFVMDLAKSGQRASGFAGSTAFLWDANKGFTVLPQEFVPSSNGSLDRTGQKMLVGADLNGNGINEPVLWSPNGITPLGDLNGNSCGSPSSTGYASATGWGLDDAGKTAVGLAYTEKDGDGRCGGDFKGEIVPFIWDQKGGMRELDTSNVDWSQTQFARAQGISGNGELVVGINGPGKAAAWLNEGPMLDLYSAFGARDVYASSYDGKKAALQTREGTLMWDTTKGLSADAVTNIGSLRWCHDIPYISRGFNYCNVMSEEELTQALGPVPLSVFDMNDNGSVLGGRAGNFFSGVVAVMWIEGVGWMNLANFLKEQGVVEASATPINNILSISADGSKLIGNVAGALISWYVDMGQVYVCNGGVSQQVGFPGGLQEAVAAGSEVGRCEFIER